MMGLQTPSSGIVPDTYRVFSRNAKTPAGEYRSPREAIDHAETVTYPMVVLDWRGNVIWDNQESKQYQREFPGFVLGVEIPPQFQDVSWRNDACPSFEHSGGMTIWVDYADPSLRVEEGAERFVLSDCAGVGILATNDWQEVLEFLESRGFE